MVLTLLQNSLTSDQWTPVVLPASNLPKDVLGEAQEGNSASQIDGWEREAFGGAGRVPGTAQGSLVHTAQSLAYLLKVTLNTLKADDLFLHSVDG